MAKLQRRSRIAVIGASIGGILMGLRLREAGFTDFTIFEKGATLGGTWRDNNYPGLACDVPAHLYVYSFEPNPNWTHKYATGPDILAYFTGVAKKYKVLPHIRYNSEIASCEWNAEAHHWELRTTAGDFHTADIVVTAVGRLHHPQIPDIKGLDTFAGDAFHSTHWKHELELDGKRIGIIGTGSTAVQLTTALAKRSEKLSLFQRTPQWVLVAPNDPEPMWRRLMLRCFPALGRRQYRMLEADIEKRSRALSDMAPLSPYDAPAREAVTLVRDPELRAKLTPDYLPGCKRIIRSPNFYLEVQRPNVDVVTERIVQVEPEGVRTADGKLHPLDILVLATGFHADAFLRPMTLKGVHGTTLDDLWKEVPLNYKSVALPEMPNFFMVNGPYSPGGTASVVAIIEVHVKYVMQLLDKIDREGLVMAPKRQLTAELLAAIRERAGKTVWAKGGCKSWYLGKDGVPLVNPLTLTELQNDMHTVKLEDFEIATIREHG